MSSISETLGSFSLMSVFLLKERKGQENPSAAVFEALLWLQRQRMLENVSVSAAFPPLYPLLHVVRSLEWIATT